ncbi:MAG: hypothetical protein AAGF72_05570 [Pseudomonadota bacterium]
MSDSANMSIVDGKVSIDGELLDLKELYPAVRHVLRERKQGRDDPRQVIEDCVQNIAAIRLMDITQDSVSDDASMGLWRMLRDVEDALRSAARRLGLPPDP